MPTLILDFDPPDVPATLTLTAISPEVDGLTVPATFAKDAGTGTFTLDVTGAVGSYAYTATATWADGVEASEFSGAWDSDGTASVGDVVAAYGPTVADVRALMGRTAADGCSNIEGTSQNTPTPDPAGYAVTARTSAIALRLRLVGLSKRVKVSVAATAGSDAANALWLLNLLKWCIDLWARKPLADLTNKTYLAWVKQYDDTLQGWWDDPEKIPDGFTAGDSGYDPNVMTAPVAIYPTVDKDGREVTPSNQRVGPYWDANWQRFRPGRW